MDIIILIKFKSIEIRDSISPVMNIEEAIDRSSSIEGPYNIPSSKIFIYFQIE